MCDLLLVFFSIFEQTSLLAGDTAGTLCHSSSQILYSSNPISTYLPSRPLLKYIISLGFPYSTRGALRGRDSMVQAEDAPGASDNDTAGASPASAASLSPAAAVESRGLSGGEVQSDDSWRDT